MSRASGHPQSDDVSTNHQNKDSDSEESQSSQVHGQGYRRAPKTAETPAANQWPSHKRHGLTVKAGPSKGSSIAVKQNMECTAISRLVQNTLSSTEVLEMLLTEADESHLIRNGSCQGFVADCIHAKDNRKRATGCYPGDYIAYDDDEEVFIELYEDIISKMSVDGERLHDQPLHLM